MLIVGPFSKKNSAPIYLRLKIEAEERGKEYRLREALRQEKDAKSAVLIQKAYRGHLCRKRVERAQALVVTLQVSE